MFVVVSYDIVDDKKRLMIAKVMESYGRRVQKSVFECILEEKKFLEMKRKLDKIMDMEVDSVRYYFLCQRCISAIMVSGTGTVSEDEQLIIV